MCVTEKRERRKEGVRGRIGSADRGNNKLNVRNRRLLPVTSRRWWP